MAGYSKRSLSEKLGIKPNYRCVILKAPDEYVKSLNLATKQLYTSYSQDRAEIVQYFATLREELTREFPRLTKQMLPSGMLWISWPKKASKTNADLDENVVRVIGLSSRVVDVKVIAIDDTWSGLKFVYRLKHRAELST